VVSVLRARRSPHHYMGHDEERWQPDDQERCEQADFEFINSGHLGASKSLFFFPSSIGDLPLL
jgi:hypothetical protein